MSNFNLVRRSGKKAYMVMTGGTASKMIGFTELSKSLNAVEYSRQYVDEDSERTDVVGYSPSISFKMDMSKDNEVHEKIAEIFDGEKMGEEACVDIVVVDFSQAAQSGAYPAYKRNYTVVPSAEGDSTDAYTYGGDFKANGEKITGTATSTDSWETCTFAEPE